MNAEAVEVSVVLPCLNEERTLGACIRKAYRVMGEAGLRGEVVVADNGSTDHSRAIAVENGARLVAVPAMGYGNALYRGLTEARGRYLVFLDADLSYEFSHIPRFIEKLRSGSDLVMGSRFRGRIDPGAMKPLHRYLGTPVLTWLANLFFGSRISDINCGMRALRRELFKRLGLRAGGMEFASEMLIKAQLLNAKVSEVPTDLHLDGRDHPPHLRTFRDGWRHLRFMLLFCPTWLFVVPGLAVGLAGLGVIAAVILNVFPYLGLFTCLVSLAATALGTQMVMLGIAARRISHMKRWYEKDDWLQKVVQGISLERKLFFGLALAASGFGLLGYTALRIWRFMHGTGYVLNRIDLLSTKLALLGATLSVMGIEIVFTAFFIGLFDIETIRN